MPEVRRTHRRRYTRPLRVIEKVEELRPKLQRDLFANRQSFADRNIPVVDAWPSDNVASQIAEGSRRRKREGAAEPLLLRLLHFDRTGRVWPLPARAHSRHIPGYCDRERSPRFEAADAGELPSAQCLIQESVTP